MEHSKHTVRTRPQEAEQSCLQPSRSKTDKNENTHTLTETETHTHRQTSLHPNTHIHSHRHGGKRFSGQSQAASTYPKMLEMESSRLPGGGWEIFLLLKAKRAKGQMKRCHQHFSSNQQPR